MKGTIIVIPVFNEAKYLPLFLKDLRRELAASKAISHVIIVDDGSKDDTTEILRKVTDNRFKLIEHRSNKGKGEAMKTGLREAVKLGADKIIFMDGDRQHEAKYLPEFITSLDKYPIVFGYRILGRGVPYFRKFGNQIARYILKNFFHINRRDLLCGYMGVHQEVFHDIHWSSSDYGVEAEISAIVGKKRMKFSEIRIGTIYLDKNKGVNLLHAFFILMKIPFWYFRY